MIHNKPHPYRARPASVTDARMLRTREALRTALLALLERKQFDQITVRDIAAEAGIGYATFFRHHASKSDLLDEIAQEQIGRLMALALPLLDARDTRVSCLALCRYVGKHRVLWSTLLTGGAAGTLREEFVNLAKQGAPGVRTSEWLPVGLGAIFGVSATVEILAWWLRQPDAYTEEQIAEILDRLVVTPALGPASSRGRAAPRRKSSRAAGTR